MKLERWRVRELHPIDLSPEAVAMRLRDLSQLDELARSLKTVVLQPSFDTVDGRETPPSKS